MGSLEGLGFRDKHSRIQRLRSQELLDQLKEQGTQLGCLDDADHLYVDFRTQFGNSTATKLIRRPVSIATCHVRSFAMSTFTVVLAELEQERSRLNNQLAAVSNALAVLNGSKSNGPARSRTLSPAARARIAAAQRARWAKVKGKKVVSISAGKRPKMSPSGLARIRAAQRARWAKWRKRQKSA